MAVVAGPIVAVDQVDDVVRRRGGGRPGLFLLSCLRRLGRLAEERHGNEPLLSLLLLFLVSLRLDHVLLLDSLGILASEVAPGLLRYHQQLLQHLAPALRVRLRRIGRGKGRPRDVVLVAARILFAERVLACRRPHDRTKADRLTRRPHSPSDAEACTAEHTRYVVSITRSIELGIGSRKK